MTQLEDWTLDAIVKTLEARKNEDETFDFKEILPPPSEERTAVSVAAFANTDGGFLIFGVKDPQRHAQLAPADLVVGLDAGVDFLRLFAEFPKKSIPEIREYAVSPPRALPNGRLVYVVHMYRSSVAPHALGHHEQGLRWPRRTKGGANAWMTVDEIRMAFVGLHDRIERRLQGVVDRLRANIEEVRKELLKTLEDTLAAVADFLSNYRYPERDQYDNPIIEFSLAVPMACVQLVTQKTAKWVGMAFSQHNAHMSHNLLGPRKEHFQMVRSKLAELSTSFVMGWLGRARDHERAAIREIADEANRIEDPILRERAKNEWSNRVYQIVLTAQSLLSNEIGQLLRP